MNEHGGVNVCDVHDAGCGDIWNGKMRARIGRESGTFGAFWTGAFDDICARDIFVRVSRVSGLRVSCGEYRWATQAKGKFMSSRGVMRTFHGVLRVSGVIVGRHGHDIRKSDARSLR